MEHLVYIWATSKKTTKVFIDNKIKITEEDIERLALDKARDSTHFNERDYDYTASIDETRI